MTTHSDAKKHKAKSSAIEYQKRVETVRSLILSGMDTDAIVLNVSEMYKVTPRMVYKYIEKARAKNQAFIEIKEAEMFSEHISIRRYIRQKAIADKNYSAALAAAKDEAALMGLYASDKQQKEYLEWLKINGLNESEAVAAFRTLLRTETDSVVSDSGEDERADPTAPGAGDG
jgi:hypothetical protein